ncbi:hypothetical protein E3N88_10682 [Mikania micrantha]|uniref:HAT C-terminal dimerisation domain-containing protein n=1 Tax=Mikania micrantha TaxID=192012 RepID=A0A5N6PB69_9ASTR|nr:hypothetical protein E3N88_10682 [Mikania micrantha]
MSGGLFDLLHKSYSQTHASCKIFKYQEIQGMQFILIYKHQERSRYKIKLVEHCFSKLNITKEQREAKLSSIFDDMHKLYNEYDIRSERMHQSSIAKSSNADVDVLDELDEFERFENQFRRVEREKSQLTMYLEEPALNRSQELDILQYWKDNQGRYPQLALMACDILSIHIIMVASEIIF